MKDFSTIDNSKDIIPSEPFALIEYIFRTVLSAHGYAVREEQIRLCKTMYIGLTDKRVSICEAEVGTGKTMAYLVAAIVAKRTFESRGRDCITVTIATSSIELQKAVIEKEIPLLSTILQQYGICSRPLTAVLRKGKEHYVCRARLEDFLSKIKRYPEKYEKLINFFSADRFFEKALDLDKMKIPPIVKGKICASGSCHKCQYADICRYRSFVRKATRSLALDFQVTNHNLYLAALRHHKEDGAILLHPSELIIIDEAHKFKEAAETAFGESLSQKDIPDYLKMVKYDGNQTHAYAHLIDHARRLNDMLFIRLDKTIHANEDNHLIEIDIYEMQLIATLAKCIIDIESHRRSNCNRSSANSKRLTAALNALCGKVPINIWAETDANGVITIGCTPRNISHIMANTVWNEHLHYVLTSGTMSDGNDFDFFMQENGLDRINRHFVGQSQTQSPFDYKNHTRLYIPSDMPFPDNNDPHYIQAIADHILQLIEATNGHTAILFTSYKVLYKVYEIVSDKLSKYSVICMTKSNRTAISDFKKCENGVLFASGSMWEGVDCIGDSLSSVIIVRLPFPIRSVALESKKQACSDVHYFIDRYAVPEMLIKLRQGIGRLIRSETDTGLIAILDRRAHSGVYCDRVQAILSKYPRVDSIKEIESFFKKIKNEEYYKNVR